MKHKERETQPLYKNDQEWLIFVNKMKIINFTHINIKHAFCWDGSIPHQQKGNSAFSIAALRYTSHDGTSRNLGATIMAGTDLMQTAKHRVQNTHYKCNFLDAYEAWLSYLMTLTRKKGKGVSLSNRLDNVGIYHGAIKNKEEVNDRGINYRFLISAMQAVRNKIVHHKGVVRSPENFICGIYSSMGRKDHNGKKRAALTKIQKDFIQSFWVNDEGVRNIVLAEFLCSDESIRGMSDATQSLYSFFMDSMLSHAALMYYIVTGYEPKKPGKSKAMKRYLNNRQLPT